MGGVEKRQELTRERAALLAAMGVQVWYERKGPTAPAGAATDSPAAAAPVQDQAPDQVPGQGPHQGPDQVNAARDLTTTSVTPADRPAPASAPEAEPQPPAPQSEPRKEAVGAVDIIEFTWVKGASGMVIASLGADRTTLQLIKDIVAYGDWLYGQAQNTAQGDFRWPQLLDTGGTPVRALSVFFDKHLPSGGWVALTGEVQPMLLAWLADIPLQLIELPDLQLNIGDAAVKKKIWSSLKSAK